MAKTDRFEVAAAEERASSEEEQERERCAAGEEAVPLVRIGSTSVYQGKLVEVKAKDPSGTKRN